MVDLIMRTVTLTDMDGNPVPGGMAECGKCQGCEFIIIRVRQQDHPHFQCIECTTSYCGTWDGSQCSERELQ
jgi:hypothetical protein